MTISESRGAVNDENDDGWRSERTECVAIGWRAGSPRLRIKRRH